MDPFKNSFEGGRNSDVSPDKLQPNQYIESHNVEIVGDSSFFALQNIAGTTHVGNIVNSPLVEVMKVLPSRYSIDGTVYKCLTIFTVIPEDTFNIYCYNTETNTLYELYEEAVDASYTARLVDARAYAEGGIDYVYFTDFLNEVRYLKCEIPSPYTPNFLTDYDLSLLRRGANGTITLPNITSGGTLLSGTYQFAYRMCDPQNKRFTKWSSLTVPIHVYNTTSTPVTAGIGLVTNRKISLTITPATEETDFFDYIQLAVVENVGPTPPTKYSLLEIQSIPGTSLSFDYKSNSRIGSSDLSDITVDLAQIQTAKTLAIKENRLFIGNINYADLTLDNGTPQITSGSVNVYTSSNSHPFSDPNLSSQYRGYFRGEVYRYGIIYKDKFGNSSPVYPLDLSSVTGNTITGGLTDMKFPDRSTSNAYTLFDGSGKIRSLGLTLNGLTNHPSWARSFEIVRVNRTGRFKNILFQTPVIPMVAVYGLGSYDNYPTKYVSSLSGTAPVTTTNTDLQPQTSGFTLVPKVLFWPEGRAYTKSGNSITYTAGQSSRYAMVFPPGSTYTIDSNKPADAFVYTGAEQLSLIDYALLQLEYSNYDPSGKTVPMIQGDDINTNITGNFYALNNNQYYFDSAWAAKSISSTNPITGFKFFDNLGQSDVLDGATIQDYASLQTEGLDWGFKPDVLRGGVVELKNLATDIMYTGAAFAAGTLNPYSAGGYIVGASGTVYPATRTNDYVTSYTGFVENSSYVQAIAIANVTLGLGDDRYGSSTDLHEYISTGAKHTFTSSEVATLEGGGNVSVDMTVFGGDCFVSPQTFKIADSAYSITGKSSTTYTNAQNFSKWGKFYIDSNTGSIMNIPVALEGVGQFVTVVLESEYNGEVRDVDTLTVSTTSNSMSVLNHNSKESIRVPLTYRYNINLNQQNSQKLYFPKPQFSFIQNQYQARIAYSDVKIYNSSEAGFDIFRVANIADLEEQFYPITKLAIAGDNLYAIQEQGISYVPTGERQIEQTDGGQLAVRSGDVIGRILVLDTKRGSQHMNSIVETGAVVYIPDNRNKNIYALSEQDLKPITKGNETYFRNMFATEIPEQYVISVYDPIRREVWFIDNNTQAVDQYCHVYNEAFDMWVSDYDFDSTCKAGAYVNQNLYLVGVVSSPGVGHDNCSLWTMYTDQDNRARLFDYNKGASVKFSVNPYPDFTKTFDNLLLNSSDRLFGAEFVVYRESAQGNQSASASIDTSMYMGNYRIKNPRDINRARLRGTKLQVTLTWKNTIAALKTAWTKFRFTARTPW